MASADLPQGAFVYPAQRQRSKAPIVLAVLALAAIAAGVGFYLMKRDDATDRRDDVAVVLPATTGSAEPDAAPVVEPVAEPPVAATLDAGIDAPVEQVAIAKPPVEPRPTTPPRPPRPRVPAEAGSGGAPQTEDDPVATTKPDPPADPGCDEVACVLEKYARPCCARYKPATETFQPKGAGEHLDKAQIRAGVDRVKPKVSDCGEQFEVKGTVKLAVSVNSDGTVAEVTVQASPDDGLGNCVAGVIRKARFAATVNGGSFTYPFVF